MATRIDITLCVSLYDSGLISGVGSTRDVMASITGTGAGSNSTFAAAAGASTTVYTRGSTAAPVLCVLIPSAAGTISIKYDTDSSAAPTWVHLPAAARVPLLIPAGGFSNASPAAQAGDDVGVPTGLSDVGRVDATIRTILFTPAAAVTTATQVQVAVLG